MRYIDHVLADVAKWSPGLRFQFEEAKQAIRYGVGERDRVLSEAEATLRAWIDTRADEFAAEPVVVNRHHLTPPHPQPTELAGRWPLHAIYVGRPPMTAAPENSDAGFGWRFARALHNPYPKDMYPDGLERFRSELRRDLKAAKVRAAAPADSPERKRPIPRVDAIDLLMPRHALVCSCVDSPWTPTDPTPADQPLPPAFKCHAHLIIAAWRARRKAGAA